VRDRLGLLTLLGLGFGIFSFSSLVEASPWLNLSQSNSDTRGFVGLSLSDNGAIRGNEQGSEEGVNTSWIGDIINENIWQGYIDKPWIATAKVRTQLTASINSYDISTNDNTSILTAYAQSSIKLYPDSTYPTTFTLGQRIGEVSSTHAYRYYKTDFSVNNTYKPEKASYSASTYYRANFDTEDADSSGGEEHDRFNQQFDFNFTDNLQSSNYTVIARSERKDQESRFNQNKRELLDENMSLQYQQNWFTSGQDSTYLAADISSNKSTITEEDIEDINRFDLAQINISSYIASKQYDNLTYNFNAFANRTEQETDVQSKSRVNDIINVFAGANWDYNDNWRFSGSLDGNYLNDQHTQTNFYSTLLSANYDDNKDLSESIKLNWFVGNSVGIEAGGINGQSYTLALGNGISKELTPLDTSLRISFDQSLNHVVDSAKDAEPDEWKINHDLNFGWSDYQNGVNSSAQLSFSDTRHLSDDPYQFQRAYFTVNRDVLLSESDSWGGGFVFEWTNTINDDGEISKSSRAWGSLFYRNSELWQVTNLRFTSELEVPFNDLLPEEDVRIDNQIATWRNRLDYRVGLLTFDLDSTLTEENYHISINVRRNFNF